MKDSEFFVWKEICIFIAIFCILLELTVFFILFFYYSDFRSILGILCLLIIILPLDFIIFLVWRVYLTRIVMNEKRIQMIRIKKPIRSFHWDEIVKVQKIGLTLVLSTSDEMPKIGSSFYKNKNIIFFVPNEAKINILKKYCPDKELLTQLEHLSS